MPTLDQKRRTAVFIDAANYHYALKEHRWKIDYLRFVDYFKSKFNVVKIFYYEGYPTKRTYLLNHPGGSLKESSEQKQKKLNYFLSS